LAGAVLKDLAKSAARLPILEGVLARGGERAVTVAA
jgi:hypothetical protein